VAGLFLYPKICRLIQWTAKGLVDFIRRSFFVAPKEQTDTSASILVMNGVPLNAVSKRLGHACAATTSNIYSHVFRMADEMAAEALDDVIFKKTSENHSA